MSTDGRLEALEQKLPRLIQIGDYRAVDPASWLPHALRGNPQVLVALRESKQLGLDPRDSGCVLDVVRALHGIPPVGGKLKAYGQKAIDFCCRHPQRDKRLSLLVGAIRSGKTWALHARMLALNGYNVAGQRLLMGISYPSLRTNVLEDLFQIVGEGNYEYDEANRWLKLYGVKWQVRTASDRSAERDIRGMTVGAAVCDELTAWPETVVMLLINRLSPAGARLYATLNPANPLHFVKQKLIDNPKLARYLEVIPFGLEDNPSLSGEYRDFLHSAYTGPDFKRFISGEWVMPSGLIYGDTWSNDLLYDQLPPEVARSDSRWVPVDYGTAHAQVYLEFIYGKGALWVDAAYIWDSVAEGWQKTDSEYGADLEKFLAQAPGGPPLVVVPPETASFQAELTARGVWFTEADNDVLNGIRRVRALMSLGKLRFRSTLPRRVFEEIAAYSWDERALERGEEKPVKRFDDAVDCCRYGCMDLPAVGWMFAAENVPKQKNSNVTPVTPVLPVTPVQNQGEPTFPLLVV